MKCAALTITVLVVALSLNTGVGAAAPGNREFLIAAVEESLAYQFWDSATETLTYSFGVCDGPDASVGWCYGLGVAFDEGDVGVPLWWSAGDYSFMEITTFLTNGTLNLTSREVSEPITGNGSGTPKQLEAAYFGTQVGPNGVDLGGFTISRIGVKFDSISIVPHYENHTTDWSVHGYVLFTQEATQAACKQGGWMYFERMDGSAFKNQGDCIQYVNTGK